MGVVHRDIKPSNLMVESRLPSPAGGRGAESSLPSPSGRGAGGEGRGNEAPHLWITDFGLAMTHTETNLTMTGDLLGTLRYMSPEQVEAKHGVLDHRTDVYSLGLTLYELLTLRPAFPGDNHQRLIRQVIEDDPRPPRQLNKAIPTDLETIVLKATAKEPESRYATAGELADDLRRFVEDTPIQARRPTLAERAARWSRRHYWAVSRGIAASFAVLLITALAIFNAHQRELEQRHRAEKNLVTAMYVLDTVYAEYVGDGSLKAAFAGDQPQRAEEITPKTHQFLEQALHFYTVFASANRDEPSLRSRVLTATIRVGECQSRLGMYGPAEQTFKRAVSLAEELVSEVQGPSTYQQNLARARAGLADVAARKGNWDQVIVDLSHAIRLDPKNAAAYNNRGNAYSAKGEFDRAIADYDAAIRLAPNLAVAHYNRGIAHLDKGHFDKGIADFDEAIRLDPNWAAAYNNRGIAHWDKGDFDKAIDDHNEAIRLDPKDANAYMNRGNAYRKKGQFDRAMAEYNEVIGLDPKDARAYMGRGVIYAEKGQFDRAMADFNEAIRLDPQHASFYYNRGCFYSNRGEFDRAIADYDQAIRLEPNDARRYLARAGARAKLGQLEDALSDVEKALEINHPAKHRAFLARFLADFEEPRLRRVDRALELATLALKQAPNHPEICTTLGAAQYRAGNWQAAVDALQKSSELKYYNVARTGFFLAMAHWQLDQKDEARQWYDQAVEWMEKNRPSDEELRRFRAEAEELMGVSETHHGDTEGTEKSGKRTHHGDTEHTEKG